MKRSVFVVTAALYGFFLVSACSQSDAGSEEAFLRTSAESAPQPQYFIGNPPVEGILATSDIGNPEWEKATSAYHRESGLKLLQGQDILASNEPVRIQHEKIQELFRAEMSPAAEWFLKTNLSLFAIDAFARAKDVPAETFAPYVEHLVAVGNPNADTVLRGLERLDGVWPEARVAAAAAQARAAAVARLSKTCPTCGEGDAAYREGRSDRERDISGALERLEALSRG